MSVTMRLIKQEGSFKSVCPWTGDVRNVTFKKSNSQNLFQFDASDNVIQRQYAVHRGCRNEYIFEGQTLVAVISSDGVEVTELELSPTDTICNNLFITNDVRVREDVQA